MTALDEYRANDGFTTADGYAVVEAELADAAIAELEAEVARLKAINSSMDDDLCSMTGAYERADEAEAALVRVLQCHSYRLPVVAQDAQTEEVGVHFIDGLDRAEVSEAIRSTDPFPAHESVDWPADLEAKLAAVEARRCVSCSWLKAMLGNYDCSGVTELRDCPDPDDFACNRWTARLTGKEDHTCV